MLSYACDCSGTGYAGLTCEDNIDDCLSNLCEHGSTCVDGVSEYTCNCTGTDYFGTYCHQQESPCSSNPCFSGGTCIVLPPALTGDPDTYTCDCDGTGYTGLHCTVELDECVSAPCQNAGVCTDFVNGFSCDCYGTGFAGLVCESEVALCGSNPCYTGQCIPNYNASEYMCNCTGKYEQIINQLLIKITTINIYRNVVWQLYE